MTVTATPIYPQSVFTAPVQFLPATSTSVPTSLIAAATNGQKIEKILCSSTDTSARDIQLFVNFSSTNYMLGTVTVPAGAGNTNAVPTVDLLSILASGIPQIPLNVDAFGNKYLYLDANCALFAEPLTTITTAKVINFHPQVGKF